MPMTAKKFVHQKINIQKHFNGKQHKDAIKELLTAGHLVEVLPSGSHSGSDSHLDAGQQEIDISEWGPTLRGAPDAMMFVQVWKTLNTGVSLAGSAHLTEFMNHLSDDVDTSGQLADSRHLLKQCALCLADAIREDARAHVKESSVITIHADASKGSYLATATSVHNASSTKKDWVLGVVQKFTGGVSAIRKALNVLIEQFATPLA